jgi:hypothetical protein
MLRDSPTSALWRKPSAEELELARTVQQLKTKRAQLFTEEQQLAALRANLQSFEQRYLREVGLLLRRLDEWERKLAELSVQQMSAEEIEAAAEELPPAPQHAHALKHMGLAEVRALFRELAKRIHPDFAEDAGDSERRTHLMAQANAAFRRADHATLLRMLHGVEAPPDTSSDIAAQLAAARHALDQVAMDIEHARQTQRALTQSEIAKLQRESIDAASQGRDLLAETAARVKGSLGMTMALYERAIYRIQHPPRGPSVEQAVTAENVKLKKRFAPHAKHPATKQ